MAFPSVSKGTGKVIAMTEGGSIAGRTDVGSAHSLDERTVPRFAPLINSQTGVTGVAPIALMKFEMVQACTHLPKQAAYFHQSNSLHCPARAAVLK
jgi:hypothetical protein